MTSFSQILFISPFTKFIFCIDSKIMCIFDNNKMLRKFRIIIYTVCIHEFVWMGFFSRWTTDYLWMQLGIRWGKSSHEQRMWYLYRTFLISTLYVPLKNRVLFLCVLLEDGQNWSNHVIWEKTRNGLGWSLCHAHISFRSWNCSAHLVLLFVI